MLEPMGPGGPMPGGPPPGGMPGGPAPAPGGGVEDVDRMIMDIVRVMPIEDKMRLLEDLMARVGGGPAPVGSPEMAMEEAMRDF